MEPPTDLPADALEVGRIGEAWGLQGWFKVQPYADPPNALLSAREWFLQPPASRAPARETAKAVPARLEITAVREHGDGIVASARGVADRNASEALRGARIFVSRGRFPSVDADEFYWADLIGCAVVDREGTPLGSVIGLLDTGPQSVLRIQPAEAGAEERLIPFVAAYVDSVDVAGKRIVVNWGADY